MVPPSSPVSYRPAHKEMMRLGAAKRLHNGIKLFLKWQLASMAASGSQFSYLLGIKAFVGAIQKDKYLE